MSIKELREQLATELHEYASWVIRDDPKHGMSHPQTRSHRSRIKKLEQLIEDLTPQFQHHGGQKGQG